MVRAVPARVGQREKRVSPARIQKWVKKLVPARLREGYTGWRAKNRQARQNNNKKFKKSEKIILF